jgi:aquaporin NIP
MLKKYIAELIGTFILVFCGTGAIIINDVSGGAITHLGIAITFGLVVLAMIYTFGDISGAHINPAVTIAFAVSKQLAWKTVTPYVLSQTAGGILASMTLKILFPENQLLGSTIPAGSDLQSFVLEIILTFILMLVIFRVSAGSKEKGIMAGAAIAAVVAMEALFAGPICGASMNPVRSLAPAIISGHMGQVWIYITAPVIGALLAHVVNMLFTKEKE